jgi:hypothetical protein
MCSIELAAKTTQKLNKNQSPFVQIWELKIVQNVGFK